MNKKEIIGICEFLKVHHFENSYKLLDYITNLQEENEYFSYCDKELRNKIKNFEYKANNLRSQIDK